MTKMMYSCNEHIEELLDIFLDENEEMPVMEKIIDMKVICHECQTWAVYQLLGSEVKTKWEWE